MATRKDEGDEPAPKAAKKMSKADAEAALAKGELAWRDYLAAVDAADD
jgi:hypothetical protein